VLFLLSYSLGLAKWGDETFLASAADSLIEALAPIYEWHLVRALRRGVLQGYRTEQAALPGVRGRLRFEEQLRRRFGLPLPMEVQFDEFTEDILENRLLRSALVILSRLPLRSDSNRRVLRRFDQVLNLVTIEAFRQEDVPPVTYTRLNEHYKGAVEWARLILRFSSIESRHGREIATTVLFNMNAVFEEFVRTALREELRLTPREFPSGAATPPLSLDALRRIDLAPDLSWWTENVCRLVGDVKYKAVNAAGVKHPDLYQLLAYTTATHVDAGVLVYAEGEGEPADHHIAHAGKVLHVRSLRLDGSIQSIREQIKGLAGFMRMLAERNARSAA
jgi:5-methylcytosine-specific restriction enzyme subunit McrC